MLDLGIDEEELKKLIKAIDIAPDEDAKVAIARIKVIEVLTNAIGKQVGSLVESHLNKSFITPPIPMVAVSSIPKERKII